MNMKAFFILGFFFCFSFVNCYTQEKDHIEYPTGFEIGTVISPLEQIENFPKPRYAKNHSMERNYNWVSSIYLLGGIEHDSILSKEEKISRVVAVQRELAEHWNYYFQLGNSKKIANIKLKNKKTDAYAAFVDFANQHPEIPVSITTFWSQLNLKTIGDTQKAPYVRRQSLDDSFYMKGFKSHSGFKILRYDVPDSLLLFDGLAQKYLFDKIGQILTRPINIINENGETRPHKPFKGKRLKLDESLNSNFKKSGDANWQVFQAKKKFHFRKTYRDQFISDTSLLKNTKFTWYAVDGNERYHFNWEESKRISTPFGSNYYATPDLYPRWPSNWFKGKGAWHGWYWLETTRKTEIKAGDLFFSPYVAAGWDADPSRNIRPSQWLGLLKCMGPIGAEFYYTAFFNINKNKIADPKNYVWQLAMPSYAQAITSKYEKFFRTGNILKDKKGKYIVSYPNESAENVLVTVRQQENRKIYIIAAAIQPSKEKPKVTTLETRVGIFIEGDSISFTARKQGSVYLYNSEDENYPYFYQLDGWHEVGHPLRWSSKIEIEAELFDKSENIQFNTTTSNGTFEDFTTSISTLKELGSLYYECPCKNETEYDFEIRIKVEAKSIKKKFINSFKLVLNQEIQNLKYQKSKQNDWTWLTVKPSKKLRCSGGKIEVSIQSLKPGVWIDKFNLLPNKSLEE